MTQNKEQQIFNLVDGALEGNPDASDVGPTDLVAVPFPTPRGGTRNILFTAGEYLDTGVKPIDLTKEGVTERLDGATVLVLGKSAIVVPPNDQPK